MDLMILKKKIDGYRAANGSIKNVPPELLLELRQTWEHYSSRQSALLGAEHLNWSLTRELR